MAIAGLIVLARHGVRVGGSNPPMVLHEAVLGLLKISDSGSPEQMVAGLDMARAWMPLSADESDAMSLPQPPSGAPLPPVAIPPVPDQGSTAQASGSAQDGGKPTEFPAEPPDPPPLA